MQEVTRLRKNSAISGAGTRYFAIATLQKQRLIVKQMKKVAANYFRSLIFFLREAGRNNLVEQEIKM